MIDRSTESPFVTGEDIGLTDCMEEIDTSSLKLGSLIEWDACILIRGLTGWGRETPFNFNCGMYLPVAKVFGNLSMISA